MIKVKQMVPGRTIIKPGRTIKIKRKISVPDEVKNKGKDPKKDVLEGKLALRAVPANFQIGEVLYTAATVNKVYQVGDIVAYRPTRAMDFELIKGTIIVDDFDIVGPVELISEETNKEM